MGPYVLSTLTLLVGLVAPQGTTLHAQTQEETSAKVPVIRTIKIQRHDVFREDEDAPPLLKTWSNRLHWMTREFVVRSDLLFKEGDKYDPEIIEETERNLRIRHYLGEVTIIPSFSEDSTWVDLTVITQDQWSTELALTSEGGGGNYLLGLQLSESNLVGYGKSLKLNYFSGSDDEGGSLLFDDPRLLFTRMNLQFYLVTDRRADYYQLSVGLPLYSLNSRWGFNTSTVITDGEKRLFWNGSEFFRYRFDVVKTGFKLLHSRGYHDKLTAVCGIDYKKLRYASVDTLRASPYRTLIPDDETAVLPGFGVTFSRIDYFTERRFDNFGNTEDYTGGFNLGFYLSRALEPLGSDSSYNRLKMRADFLSPVSDNTLVSGESILTMRFDEETERLRLRSRFHFFHRFGDGLTFAARTYGIYTRRMEKGYQVLLGGDSGLRGYESWRFAGNRLMLTNIEQRYYSPVEILTIGLGTAVFFDYGYAWYGGQDVGLDDFRADVGIGLRFGLTKSTDFDIIRLDFARPLDGSGYFISFGTGNLFRLDDRFLD